MNCLIKHVFWSKQGKMLATIFPLLMISLIHFSTYACYIKCKNKNNRGKLAAYYTLTVPSGELILVNFFWMLNTSASTLILISFNFIDFIYNLFIKWLNLKRICVQQPMKCLVADNEKKKMSAMPLSCSCLSGAPVYQNLSVPGCVVCRALSSMCIDIHVKIWHLWLWFSKEFLK